MMEQVSDLGQIVRFIFRHIILQYNTRNASSLLQVVVLFYYKWVSTLAGSPALVPWGGV